MLFFSVVLYFVILCVLFLLFIKLLCYFPECPNPCHCRSDTDGIHVTWGYDVIDGNSRLTEVPSDIPLDTIQLDLSHHSIKKLNLTNLEKCFNLTWLDFSRGGLESIEPGALNDVPNLKYLSLFSNYLQFTRSSLPNNLFSNMYQLQTLHLNLQHKGLDYEFSDFEGIMDELPRSLKTLSVDLNSRQLNATSSECDESSYPIFGRFTDLNDLSLYRSMSCRTVISNGTFRPLAELPIKNLTISYMSLSGIQPLAFSWFTNLTYLNMSGTLGISVADFYPAFIGFQKTKISKLILSSFRQNLKNSDPVVLNRTFFRYFVLPHLTSLHLDNTNIGTTELWGMPEILTNLRHFDLSNNYIGSHDPDDRVTDFTEALQNLRVLDLSSQSTSRSANLTIYLSLMMRKVDMSRFNSASEPLKMHQINILNQNRLKHFIFSHNSLESLDIFTIREPRAKVALTLDLSHNVLSRFSMSMLQKSLSNGLVLHKLLLSHNRLGEHFANDNGETFSIYSDLRTLDLSFNGIRTLSKSTFGILKQLEVLDLTGNYLDSIEFKFSQMFHLVDLDLSDNRLTRLEFEFQTELWMTRLSSEILQEYGIARQQNMTFAVNMVGNVFECSCDTLTWLQWIQEHNRMIVNLENYYCFQDYTEGPHSKIWMRSSTS